MEPFQRALAFVLAAEGGAAMTNDPRDAGGLTRFGISQRAYPRLDIASLTKAQAEQLYRRDYWLLGCCDGLPAPVGLMHFDTAVNMGITTANTLLQLAAGVDPDGQIGPKSLAAINRANRRDLCIEYASRRIVRYAGIKSFDRFGLGWVRRTHACLALALTVMEP
jgi:lysozyme family protein